MRRTLAAQVPQARLVILDAIAEGATVAEACRKAKCGQASFYRWQEEDKEFGEGVARARAAFGANADDDTKAATSARILDLLRNGETIVRTSKKTLRAGDGAVEKVVEERHVEQRPTPKWVIDKVLPDSVLEAIAAAAAQGGAVNVHVDARRDADK